MDRVDRVRAGPWTGWVQGRCGRPKKLDRVGLADGGLTAWRQDMHEERLRADQRHSTPCHLLCVCDILILYITTSGNTPPHMFNSVLAQP